MKKRPLGILILSVLSIIGGLGLLIIQILFHSNLGQLMSEFNASAIILFISLTFLSLSYAISGIGMLLGRKWGWWLGAFCVLYAVVRNINALVEIFRMAEIVENSTKGIEYYLTKHIGRIAINCLVFSYFFKDNVMEYFKIRHYSKLKTILKLIGLGVGVFAIFSIISLFFL